MGFKKPERNIRLIFEDPDFAGAEILCTRNANFQFLQDMDDIDTEELFAERVDQWVKTAVTEWNLENEDGTPTAKDGPSFLSEWPAEFVLSTIKVWRKALFGLPDPLVEESPNGLMEQDLNLAELSSLN